MPDPHLTLEDASDQLTTSEFFGQGNLEQAARLANFSNDKIEQFKQGVCFALVTYWIFYKVQRETGEATFFDLLRNITRYYDPQNQQKNLPEHLEEIDLKGFLKTIVDLQQTKLSSDLPYKKDSCVEKYLNTKNPMDIAVRLAQAPGHTAFHMGIYNEDGGHAIAFYKINCNQFEFYDPNLGRLQFYVEPKEFELWWINLFEFFKTMYKVDLNLSMTFIIISKRKWDIVDALDGFIRNVESYIAEQSMSSFSFESRKVTLDTFKNLRGGYINCVISKDALIDSINSIVTNRFPAALTEESMNKYAKLLEEEVESRNSFLEAPRTQTWNLILMFREFANCIYNNVGTANPMQPMAEELFKVFLRAVLENKFQVFSYDKEIIAVCRLLQICASSNNALKFFSFLFTANGDQTIVLNRLFFNCDHHLKTALKKGEFNDVDRFIYWQFIEASLTIENIEPLDQLLALAKDNLIVQELLRMEVTNYIAKQQSAPFSDKFVDRLIKVIEAAHFETVEAEKLFAKINKVDADKITPAL